MNNPRVWGDGDVPGQGRSGSRFACLHGGESEVRRVRGLPSHNSDLSAAHQQLAARHRAQALGHKFKI